MYDHIEGEVTDKHPARVVLHANGVGYEIDVPTNTAARIAVGQRVRLFTILHVVDGVPSLIGFAGRPERELARRLLSVSGVGKAMSLAILSTYAAAEVATAILKDDHQALRRVKGVGAKTAERLCLELRDHVAKMDLPLAPQVVPPDAFPSHAEDAVLALITLGFSPKEARAKTERALVNRPDADTETLIKTVLRS